MSENTVKFPENRREVILGQWVAFTKEELCFINNKFNKMCDDIIVVDNDKFDEFCKKIAPLCEEIYQIGKHRKWPASVNDNSCETPTDTMIYSVGSVIEAYILPCYKKQAKKSISFYKMICDVINKKKYKRGRRAFIELLWPITHKTDGINIKNLLADTVCGPNTVAALLKLRDGRFVKEVKQLQNKIDKETWIVLRKKISLYIERYDKQEQ